MRLEPGAVAIVTGASEGIGRALCLALAPRRLRLVLAARNEARLRELAAECESLGATCLVVAGDLAAEASCRRLVERTVATFGAVDVVVNNAGRTVWTRLDQLTDVAVIEDVMRINYLGTAWLTYYALPHLVERRGRIVAIASVAGLNGVPERAPYAASKHAVVGFCDSLRIELAPLGVSVTVIAPDFVLTEAHRRAVGPDGEPLGASPLEEGRIMTAAECAHRIVRAIDRRERLVITSLRGRVGRWFKLLSPGLVDRIAARAIRRRD